MADTPFHPLASETDWSEALSRSEDRPVLVFKHSAACPVSSRADTEMQALTEEVDLPVYRLVVQESRPLSDEIADVLNVSHETPQAILLDDGEPVFNTSHFNVTVDSVRKALRATDNAH